VTCRNEAFQSSSAVLESVCGLYLNLRTFVFRGVLGINTIYALIYQRVNRQILRMLVSLCLLRFPVGFESYISLGRMKSPEQNQGDAFQKLRVSVFGPFYDLSLTLQRRRGDQNWSRQESRTSSHRHRHRIYVFCVPSAAKVSSLW
jgi:hypothetical protein